MSGVAVYDNCGAGMTVQKDNLGATLVKASEGAGSEAARSFPCRWRGAPRGGGRYDCLSPKLTVHPSGVPILACAGCYLRDHPPERRAHRAVYWVKRVRGVPVRPLIFLRALVRHARDWFRTVPRAEFLRRVAACSGCRYYSKDYPGGRCAACGCGVRGQIGEADAGGTALPWWAVSVKLRLRLAKVWGKAWWESEDCPVCRRCDRKVSEGCHCQPFVSKWKEGAVPLTVIAKFPGGGAGSAAEPLNVKNGEA